ncbi:MAG: exonuclease SbcCD subunit D [Gemmataceae bacterium]|nr:exonuclease SbcCD subunit D [Gemmataceae bacterium]
MRIMHTADWHLGDRLGRIDRTADLRRAVERVAKQCHDHKVDTLLVAGDLFSELARPDTLRETIHHWQEVFADFLGRGGTILAITGNHDNENFCRTLSHAMALAAPTVGAPGEPVPPGRFYLAAEPTFVRLGGIQFFLMPYPTPTRYLRGESNQKYTSPEEKQKMLISAFERTLQGFREHPRFESIPTVLVAHATVRGADIGTSLFRLNLDDDVQVNDTRMAEQYAYVALGHIHKPQCLGGHQHVRYSGSIEKMDLGEQLDSKRTVLFELGPKGLVGEIVELPLPSTGIFELLVNDPTEDLPRLRTEYPEPTDDLVKLRIRYTRGKDNLEEILRELEAIFPRWYSRDWTETNDLGPTLTAPPAERSHNFAETVRDYAESELAFHNEGERAELLIRLNALIEEFDTP